MRLPCAFGTRIRITEEIMKTRAVFTHGPTWAMARGGNFWGRQSFQTKNFIAPFHDLSIHAHDTSNQNFI